MRFASVNKVFVFIKLNFKWALDGGRGNLNVKSKEKQYKKKHILLISVYVCFTAWVGGFLSITLISLLALVGVVLIPLMNRVCFNFLLSFLVALAVGTLSGDAFLHLIPHVSTNTVIKTQTGIWILYCCFWALIFLVYGSTWYWYDMIVIYKIHCHIHYHLNVRGP